MSASSPSLGKKAPCGGDTRTRCSVDESRHPASPRLRHPRPSPPIEHVTRDDEEERGGSGDENSEGGLPEYVFSDGDNDFEPFPLRKGSS